MKPSPTTRSIALALLVAAGQPASAGDECDAPAQAWRPRGEVHGLAERNGWHVDKLKIDDGCYEITGRDAEGRRFKAKLDPATLDVVRMKRQRAARDRADDADPPSSSPSTTRGDLPTRSPDPHPEAD